MLAGLNDATPLLAGIDGPVMVDIDDTIIEVHLHGKQGSGYGYSGVRGLNALLATATTDGCAPVICGQRLRKGACGCPRGAARMVGDTLATLARLCARRDRRARRWCGRTRRLMAIRRSPRRSGAGLMCRSPCAYPGTGPVNRPGQRCSPALSAATPRNWPNTGTPNSPRPERTTGTGRYRDRTLNHTHQPIQRPHRNSSPHRHRIGASRINSSRASMPTWCAGSARNTNDCAPRERPSSVGGGSSPGIPACSRTGNGRPRFSASGDPEDKSPVTGDCHAGICGSPGVQFPRATRPMK
jgi:hypothetical protein